MPQPPSSRPSQMQKKPAVASQRHLSLRSSPRKGGEPSDKQSRPWLPHISCKRSTPAKQARTQQPSIEVKHHYGDQSFEPISNYSPGDEASPTTDRTFSRLRPAHVPRPLENFSTDLEERSYAPQVSRSLVASSALHGCLRTAPRIFVEPRLNEPSYQAPNHSTMDTAQLSPQYLYQRGPRTREVQQVPVPSSSSSPLWPPYVTSHQRSAVLLPSDSGVSAAGLDNIHLKTRGLSTKAYSQSQPQYQHGREYDGNADGRKHLYVRGAHCDRSLPQDPNNAPETIRRNTTSPNTLANYFMQMQVQSRPPDMHRPIPPIASAVPAPFHPAVHGTNDVGVSLTGPRWAVSTTTLDSALSHNFPYGSTMAVFVVRFVQRRLSPLSDAPSSQREEAFL